MITGIRSLGEAKALKAAGGTLLYVDAPLEVRYKRVQARRRDNEAKLTLEEFQANEEKEMYSGPTDADFNIRGIGAMADVTITNVLPLSEYIELAYQRLGLR